MKRRKQKSFWVSMKDELPPERTKVIVYTEDGDMYMDMMYVNKFKEGIDKYIFGNQFIERWQTVTHWMPLPKPPRCY